MSITSSALLDSLKVAFPLKHPPMSELASLSAVRRNGKKFYVVGDFGTRAEIYSRPDNKALYIEASVSKFLTGQNLVGILNIRQASQDLILKVLEKLEMDVDRKVRRILDNDNYRFLKADLAAHVKCGSDMEQQAVMVAMQRLAMTTDHQVAEYTHESVYIDAHSRHRATKGYLKGVEIVKRGLPSTVYGRRDLVDFAKHLIRIEVRYLQPALQRYGLDTPSGWDDREAIVSRLKRHVNFLLRAEGRVPSVDRIDELATADQLKLRAWLLGDPDPFALSPTTAAASRRRIFEVTGIMPAGPITAEEQAQYVKTIRDVIKDGVGYKTFDHRWDALKAGRRRT